MTFHQQTYLTFLLEFLLSQTLFWWKFNMNSLRHIFIKECLWCAMLRLWHFAILPPNVRLFSIKKICYPFKVLKKKLSGEKQSEDIPCSIARFLMSFTISNRGVEREVGMYPPPTNFMHFSVFIDLQTNCNFCFLSQNNTVIVKMMIY